ncbi:MAG: non-ribosomal peptide synthetase, partial [Tumebacillaceae bacterium]
LRVHLFARSEQEHVLLLVIHHIIADGWSLGVLLRDVQALYAAQKDGVAPNVVPLPATYAEHVAWQREWLESAEGTQQSAFWLEKLRGELPVLSLPTDRPRPPVQTYAGATRSIKLGAELTRELKQLAVQEGATLYTVLLAAYQVLLYRYTGQEDLLVGSPSAGRNRAKDAQVMGYFVNPVVMRASVTGDVSFAEFFAQVRQQVREALAHQEYPFALLVEKLQPVRDPSYSPLFQTMFVLQSLQAMGEGVTAFALNEAGMRLPGELGLETMALEQRDAQFDLTLFMAEVGDELVASLEYNTDLFDATTIERMLGHLHTLLDGIVTNPQQVVGRLPFLTEAERHQVFVEWNETATDFASDACVQELIEQWAVKTPDGVAVVYEGQQLTYAELNRRANKLAHALLRRGVLRDQIVGICMERSTEQIVALLAVLKAGAAYCPMDITLPQERLAYMAADAGVTVLLTQEALVSKFADCSEELQGKLLCLDGAGVTFVGESDANPNVDVSPDDLAYVIYTSGTTGQPKGVMVPHRGLVNLLDDFHKRKPLQTGDACSVWGNFGFDLSALEIFVGLTNGLRVHLFPDDLRADSEAYFRWLADNEIKGCYIAPFMHKPLIAWLNQGNSLHVQRVQIGVESIYEPEVADMDRRLPEGVVLLNAYGPTEITVAATIQAFDPSAVQERNMPIGKPLQNTQVYLLDGLLQPVPIGVPGELYVGGVQVTRGYKGREDLTSEVFIKNPFLSDLAHPHARLYKTGDLGRLLADGTIDFLGRVDHQVKVRGYRIELSEIESVLAGHPAIRHAVALAREEGVGGKTLVAYYTLLPEREAPSNAELRALLKGKLPSYMVPSAIVRMEEMPLNANRKIDRRALPAPDKSQFMRDNEYVAPRTPTEVTLAALFGEVLQVEQVGVHDSFFELGGHSLLATQLV